MRNGFKVFDADAHVIYPADLWSRFLDKKFQDRVVRRPPAGFDHYQPTMIDGPGLPFSLVFRSEPGTEDSLVRIASTYEAASRSRVSPPAFGPLG